MNKSLLLFTAFSLLFIFSCRNTKEAGTTIKVDKQEPEVLLAELTKNNYDFETFSARLKIRYSTEEKSQSFTANLRMIKDSIIWSNFTSLMGIEVGRALVRKDSIFLLDRMGKVYYERPYDFIENYLPYSLSLEQVQDILLGKFTFEIDDKAKSRVKNKQHLLLFQDGDFSVELQLEPREYLVKDALLEDKQEKRSVQFLFDDYEVVDSIDFSTERNIFFKGEKPLEAEINFSRIKWNEPVDFPFFVGSRYERK